MFFLKCSESGPLFGPACLPSLFVDEPTFCVSKFRSPHFQAVSLGIESTRTPLASNRREMRGMAAARGVSILDALYSWCLVRVWEPVLAHVEVVAEASGAASHEDLGNGDRRHVGFVFRASSGVFACWVVLMY